MLKTIERDGNIETEISVRDPDFKKLDHLKYLKKILTESVSTYALWGCTSKITCVLMQVAQLL